MSERYFSRITLRADASATSSFWKVFRDPYSLHKSIWSLFSDGPDRTRDFLYHLADTQRPPVIYAVSARSPLVADACWQVSVKEYQPRLTPGMRLEFSLRANPVVTRNGKRHDVVMDAKRAQREILNNDRVPSTEAESVQEACGQWLVKRAELCGFRHVAVRADGYRQHYFSKHKQKEPVKFSTVDFTGMLEVLDPDRLRKTLYEGIGHAKGLGCGLMLIRRC